MNKKPLIKVIFVFEYEICQSSVIYLIGHLTAIESHSRVHRQKDIHFIIHQCILADYLLVLSFLQKNRYKLCYDRQCLTK